MLPLLLSLLLAFGGVVLLAPMYIRLLQRLGFGKAIRAEGPAAHAVKAGTPTLGGMLMILVVMFLAMAMRLEDVSTLTPMLTLVGVGILGAIDDYVNVRTGFGVRGRYKLVWQTVVAILAAVYIQRHFDITAINVPLLGELAVGAVAVVAFVAFAIVAMSNAVNLTDGLDGLASGLLVFSFVAYLLIALVEVPGLKLSQPNLAVLCALLGCAHTQEKSGMDGLKSAAETFFQRIRWRDFRGASELLIAERRPNFLRARASKNDDKDLTITDYELEDARLGPDRGTAEVITRVSWIRLPSVSESSEVVRSEFVFRQGVWMLARQDKGPFVPELKTPLEAPSAPAP